MAVNTTKKAAAEEEYTAKPQVETISATSTDSYDEYFTIINHNGEFLIAIGNQVVCRKKFQSLQEAETYIDSKPWDIILNATAFMFNKLKEAQSWK
jgi:hypothetical protein